MVLSWLLSLLNIKELLIRNSGLKIDLGSKLWSLQWLRNHLDFMDLEGALLEFGGLAYP
jgi:hypothetical protein